MRLEQFDGLPLVGSGDDISCGQVQYVAKEIIGSLVRLWVFRRKPFTVLVLSSSVISRGYLVVSHRGGGVGISSLRLLEVLL